MPASSNTRSRPVPVAREESYAIATVVGPEYLAVVDTRNSHAFHFRPAVVERALAQSGDGAFPLEADDGRYTVSLRRVVYVKRFMREGRVGFTAA